MVISVSWLEFIESTKGSSSVERRDSEYLGVTNGDPISSSDRHRSRPRERLAKRGASLVLGRRGLEKLDELPAIEWPLEPGNAGVSG